MSSAHPAYIYVFLYVCKTLNSFHLYLRVYHIKLNKTFGHLICYFKGPRSSTFLSAQTDSIFWFGSLSLSRSRLAILNFHHMKLKKTFNNIYLSLKCKRLARTKNICDLDLVVNFYYWRLPLETQGFNFVTSGRRRESLTGNATLHLYPHFKPLQVGETWVYKVPYSPPDSLPVMHNIQKLDIFEFCIVKTPFFPVLPLLIPLYSRVFFYSEQSFFPPTNE